ncbi:MAG: hypothetical protein PVG70_00830 [Desulfobacterales bacterium]
MEDLYTAVHHQIPPDSIAWSPVGSIPVVPLPEEQPPDSAVVLLFDTSGSMNGNHGGNAAAEESHKRLSLAKWAKIPFVYTGCHKYVPIDHDQ